MLFLCLCLGLSSFVIGYHYCLEPSYTLVDPDNRIKDASCNRIMDMKGKNHELTAENIDLLCDHQSDFWPKLTTKDELHAFTNWILKALPQEEDKIKIWIDLRRMNTNGMAHWKWPNYKRKGFPVNVHSGWNLTDDMTCYWAKGEPLTDLDHNCAYAVVSRSGKRHEWLSSKCNESLNTPHYICQRIADTCYDCSGSDHQLKGSFMLISFIAFVVGTSKH